MRVVSRRVFAILAACILAVASFGPVTAQTSDSVVVTGSIVAAPLSITVSTESIAFGNLDYSATTQTGTVLSQGFLASGGNGALWVANTQIDIQIESPAAWTSSACIQSSVGLPATQLKLLPNIPVDEAAANVAFQGPVHLTTSCSPGLQWTSGNVGNFQRTRYLGTWVQNSDALGSFSATITFSVSAT